MAAVPGNQVITSMYRPGDTGSFHSDASNPAVDIGGANLYGVFSHLAANYANQVRELIYGNTIIQKGQLGYYAPNDHWDHVHLADKGGIFQGPGAVKVGNIREAMIPLSGPHAQSIGPTYNFTIHADSTTDATKLAKAIRHEFSRVEHDRARVGRAMSNR
jgi:hypothetical protein